MSETKTETTEAKENATSEVSDNEVEDTFLGIKSKNIFFVFVWMFFAICSQFVLIGFYHSFLLFILYIILYIWVIKNKNFQTIWQNWFVWNIILVLFALFWDYVYLELYRFYNTFFAVCDQPITCTSTAHTSCGSSSKLMCIELKAYTENIGSIITLIFSSLFTFTRFNKKIKTYKPKNEKNFLFVIFTKTPKFIKTISCFILSAAICFAVLVPLQYTLRNAVCAFKNTRSDLLPCSDTNKQFRNIELHPTKTTDVLIKLGAPEKVSLASPEYIDGWIGRAEPNGNFWDVTTGWDYYSLYWKGKEANLPLYDDGFVVAKYNVTPFLEDKLAKLGLNEREANEFIIYWLPKLESAPYTFIHFVSKEEQNEIMPLAITPKADTVIRVLMAFKRLYKPIKVVEQVLPTTPKRNGFTVIEWGGTEIGTQLIE